MKNEINVIGYVTEIVDETTFIFLSNNNTICQLQEIVGISISKKEFVLAKIDKIEVNYFLNDSNEFFTSLASDNKLGVLEEKSMSPKYSYKIVAIILGSYIFNNEDIFKESQLSINKHTPFIFQKVFSFDFNIIQTIYSLINNSEIKLGKFLYPKQSETAIDIFTSKEIFNYHTLISGVTGSGKTRLSGLLVKQIANSGGHVSIIDPHDEYEGFFQNSINNAYNIYKYKIVSSNYLKTDNEIRLNKLSFSTENFTAQVLVKFLPMMSEQQEVYVYKVFNEIGEKSKISPRKLIEFIISDFSSAVSNEEPDFLKKLTESDHFAKQDARNYETYCTRYINHLGINSRYIKSGNLQVIFAVLRKIINSYVDKSFQEKTSTWEDKNISNVIDILNVDYDSNENIRRYINAILQSFFSVPEDKVNWRRVIVIDEAHLLLGENSNTTKLLNRLLRESRKLGLSLIFITQNENDVSPEIRSQFQNKFQFREENNKLLIHLPDQTCSAKLYNGKLNFLMKVDSILRSGEN